MAGLRRFHNCMPFNGTCYCNADRSTRKDRIFIFSFIVFFIINFCSSFHDRPLPGYLVSQVTSGGRSSPHPSVGCFTLRILDLHTTDRPLIVTVTNKGSCWAFWHSQQHLYTTEQNINKRSETLRTLCGTWWGKSAAVWLHMHCFITVSTWSWGIWECMVKIDLS